MAAELDRDSKNGGALEGLERRNGGPGATNPSITVAVVTENLIGALFGARCQTDSADVRTLIRTMSRQNPLWGAELHGFTVSS
jgi:hypothetical protein